MEIEAIIDPYKKKIEELEKIIKQKDNEIFLLNEKLYGYENNLMNQNNNNQMAMNQQINNNMMINSNWMYPYNNMKNINNMNLGSYNSNDIHYNFNDFYSNINIIFEYNENEYNESCNLAESTEKIFRRFCKKLGIKLKNHKFYKYGKPIYSHLSVAEAGISNNSIIKVVKVKSSVSEDEESDSDGFCQCEEMKINIRFATTQGTTHNIIISQKHSIEELIKQYLTRVGKRDQILPLKNGEKRIMFLFNYTQLSINDNTKIEDFFKNVKNPKIVVNDVFNLIGA